MKHLYNALHGRTMPMLFLLSLLFFTQCTSSKLAMQGDGQVKELGLCLQFAPGVPAEFQEQFQDSLNQYVINFNKEAHAFKLTCCQDTSSVILRVEQVKYTTPGIRATGAFVSTLGIFALPVVLSTAGSPVVFGFYYLPRNTTIATTSFSPDLAHYNTATTVKKYETFGMFGNDQKQRLRHASKFNLHLSMMLREVETRYVKGLKKQQRMAARPTTQETATALN